MDLWQLEIFHKVIELKGFSRAAEAVHISQPTVSSHIKDLEEHFGCQLIDRIEKKAFPTRAGEILFEYANRLLSLRNDTESAMANFKGKISGKLRLGGSNIPGGYILPKLVGKFIKVYPEVNVSLKIGDSEEIIADINNSRVDLGLVGVKSNYKKIIQEILMEDHLCLVIPKNHKWADYTSIGLKDLQNEPLILREEGSGTLKTLKNSLTRAGLKLSHLNVIANMGSTTAVLQCIRNNIGVSILSSIPILDEVNSNLLSAIPIEELNLDRHFYITRHKDRTESPLTRAFIDFIKKEGVLSLT